MRNWLKSILLPGALLLYFLLWKLLHPYLGYMLDSDCVAYLTLARRICEGQYLQSVNGLWSPLNVWMIVPLMKGGMEAFMAAKVLNFCFGAVVLMQVNALFLRFRFSVLVRGVGMFCAAVVMAYFVYMQLFGDVLQLIFVLAYLHLLWSPRFFSSVFFPMLAGAVMAFAFYAKAYSLVFFLLHFTVMLWMAFRHHRIGKGLAIRMGLAAFSVTLMLILPWSLALHQKYGVWSVTGFAGKLNMSWYIQSGKTFRPDIRLLIPPAADDSPSFWEDPYPTQDRLSTPLSSPTHFVRWTARCVHTCLVAVGCFQEITFLAFALILCAGWFFFFRKTDEEPEPLLFEYQTLILTIVLLPVGYLMMHIETRYIWLNTFLLMILAAWVWQRSSCALNKYLRLAAGLITAGSFVVFPVLQIEQLKGKNKSLFDTAAALKEHQFKGRFTSNVQDAGTMWVIAYLTGSSFYTIERSDYTAAELLDEMRRYQVKYYVYSSENNVWEPSALSEHLRLLYRAGDVLVYELH